MSRKIEKATELLISQSSGSPRGGCKQTATITSTCNSKRLLMDHNVTSNANHSPGVVVIALLVYKKQVALLVLKYCISSLQKNLLHMLCA